MNELVRFFEGLFTEGAVRLRGRPDLAPADRPAFERLLRDAYAEHALSVAWAPGCASPGSRPPFDADAAVRAALLLADACWFLFSHEEPPEEVERRLTWEPDSLNPGRLLSADLSLRYLPEIYRRARGRDAGDPLVRSLAGLLRRWPLAGVLAGLSDGPLAPLDFAGHGGLQLLYAERLALVPGPAWVPADGPTRQWVDLVFHRQGRPVPRPVTTSRQEEPA